VVIPRTFADYYDGTRQFTFKIAYADNQSLVMLYDQAKGYNDLAIIVNFKTHDSWPIDRRPPDRNYDEANKKAQIFFEQLQRENFDLYRPRGLAP
jgi:hypothetical protein